jgi:protease I
MKALLIVAPDKFRDEEYFYTKEELENAGVEVTTASRSAGTCLGMLGGTAEAEFGLRDINIDDYGAVAFIGGGGSSIYFNNPAAHQIAKKAYEDGKVVAALCIASSILANAGLLKGKKATAFSSEEGNLKAKGAEWTGDSLTVDGKIITADGPGSARDFGKTIAKSL